MAASGSSSVEQELFTYNLDSGIRGYHVYKDTWDPFEGEILNTKHEIGNVMDKRAVAVLKTEVIVGHLPRENSKVFFFMRCAPRS